MTRALSLLLLLGACSLPHVTACAPKPSDLCFYQTSEGSPLPAGVPTSGEHVTLYGNSLTGGPRQAQGVIIDADVELYDRGVRGMFIQTDAAYGFSAGPVEADGQWLGIATDRMLGTAGSIKGLSGVFAYRAQDVLRQFEARR